MLAVILYKLQQLENLHHLQSFKICNNMYLTRGDNFPRIGTPASFFKPKTHFL